MKTARILLLFISIMLIQSAKSQVINGDQQITGKLGIGPSAPLTFLDCNDISENTVKSILARLSEGEVTYLGVKSYWTNWKLAGTTTSALVKSFAIEHLFYNTLNSSINFYRGTSITGGYITIGVDQGKEDFKFKRNLLEVNGKIRTKEVVIETVNWWSDFVFDKNYKLPSLAEVESHIKEHKHLPDVPSEAEVKENGINVVEMQAKLLQKIEELTLYVIDQQKEIKELKDELKTLKQSKD